MKIAIVGCGNMGLAYAHSFLKHDLVSRQDLLLIEKNEARKQALEKLGIGQVVSNFNNSLAGYEVIILAVKPQDFTGIKEELRKALVPGNIILSIMAGIRIPFLEKALCHTCIVRAMPNSPVQMGLGMTAFATGQTVSLEQVIRVESLLNSTGRTTFLKDEQLLDAVTALSGTGPAYFFYFVKHLIEAGIQMGLDPSVSSLLVQQTMLGSLNLINNSDLNLDELIAVVKSKGGTTEAALLEFQKGNLGTTLIKGVLAAENRAKELSVFA
jgi:pyrroline-5-carboxylate reductase